MSWSPPTNFVAGEERRHIISVGWRTFVVAAWSRDASPKLLSSSFPCELDTALFLTSEEDDDGSCEERRRVDFFVGAGRRLSMSLWLVVVGRR